MMTTPPSASPSSEPLLQSFYAEPTHKNNQSSASLCALEDVEESSSNIEELRRTRSRAGFWERLRMSMRRRRNGEERNDEFRGVRLNGEEKRNKFRWGRKRRCLAVPVVVLVVFGVIHIVNFLIGYIPLFWDDPAASSLDWTLPGQASSDIASHLLDITQDVTPIPCHSHNDYWRRVPLYDALRWGCTGVEADVWLFDDELFVGHSTNALTQNKTFRSMYVDPLVKMLDHKNALNDFTTPSNIKNGVFDTSPEQTLVLLVDFKNDGRAIFPYVHQHLTALRGKGYLTHFDGTSTIPRPITVVATGNAPFDMIVSNTTYRDIFFDAPLASMYEPSPSSSPNGPDKKLSLSAGQGTVGTSPTSHFDSTNSYYASVNFRKALGFVWWGGLSTTQLDLLRGQIRGAHARGLKARYWSAPKWPVALRNRMWSVLVQEGVDYLNGDDLYGMTRVDWGERRHWSLVG